MLDMALAVEPQFAPLLPDRLQRDDRRHQGDGRAGVKLHGMDAEHGCWIDCPRRLHARAPERCQEQRAAQTDRISLQSSGHTPFPANGYRAGEYLFHGYRCGTDCLLHQKGYQWASERRIANPKDCAGISEEFIEGCLAFAGVEGPLGERDFDVSFPHMSGIN